MAETKQPAVGIIATVIIMAISLGFISLFELSTFTGWVAYCIECVIPMQIVIGVTYPDLTALRALGPEYDNGDVALQWQALLDGWHKQHLVPINGRDIELRFAKYL